MVISAIGYAYNCKRLVKLPNAWGIVPVNWLLLKFLILTMKIDVRSLIILSYSDVCSRQNTVFQGKLQDFQVYSEGYQSTDYYSASYYKLKSKNIRVSSGK